MISSRLSKVVAKVFGIPETGLTPETGMGDFEAWDSLGHLRLMMELEREFHIRFSTEQIRTLTSLAEIQDVLLSERRT